MGIIDMVRPRLVPLSLSLGAVVVVLALCLLMATSGSGPSAHAETTATTSAPAPEPTVPATAQPVPESLNGSSVRNVVVVLADDLDTAAFDQIPRLHALRAEGLSLRNHVVTDSLCCPSRTSILRSQYVHNHQVVSNTLSSGGGWATFAKLGEEKDCLPTWLHAAGIHTAFLGKYLNGYGEEGDSPDPTAIPPGWDRWFVPTTKNGMYRGFGYTVNDNGALVTYGLKPRDQFSQVLIKQTKAYLQTAKAPFYLQVNPTNPHDPYPVAAKHHGEHAGDQVPRTPSYNVRGKHEPQWRTHRRYLSPARKARYDAIWRKRLRSAESIADTVDAVRSTLRKTGQLSSTLIIVTSDNGFHVGNRRISPGKRTPYLEDTVVPFVALGPGIAKDSSTKALTSTIDLAPTIGALLGAAIPEAVDGRSIIPLLSGSRPANWRNGLLSESLSTPAFNDPDFQAFKPPRFEALRTQEWLYVEYSNGEKELFNRIEDPFEIDNVLPLAPAALVSQLSAQLHALQTCAGAACRTADSWSQDPAEASPGPSPSTPSN